jgi:ankyrin repeat protein
MSELIDAAKAGDGARVREILREAPAGAAARAESGETALMAALYRGHRDLANEIADAVIKARQFDIFAAAALGRLDDLAGDPLQPDAVNSYAYDGWTPLHLAAFFGHRGAVERLLAAGAALGAVSHNSLTNTPLHAATAGQHTDVALLLIERGADVNARDSGGHTPLHIAAENGSVPVVEAMLASGGDPLAVDADDQTPLSRAAAKNHTAVVDLINVGR